MIKQEIIQRFREENPEATANVVTDSVLDSWAEVGDQETCIRARLIRGDETFPAVVGERAYNLSNEINNFYDVDEIPGGGVSYNDKRLTLETPSSLDAKRPSWRTASNGTPKDYYRRNQFIYVGTPPDDDLDIQVYTVLLPDPFDNDTKTPFNQLSYLEPFHYAIVLYLKMRFFNGKVKKPDAGAMAQQEYSAYIDYMKKEIDRGIYTPIQLRPPVNYRGVSRRRG